MCILIATVAHPDYSLILLSNRDEYLDRPTKKADFWPEPHPEVLGPYDLARPEHGTWLGITKTGRIAVLLNFHEPGDLKQVAEVSRGLFTNQFLTSKERPQQWIEKERNKYKDALESAGGFTMVCGSIVDAQSLELFSNRGDHGRLFGAGDTVSLSNSHLRDPWPKANMAADMLGKVIKDAKDWNEDHLLEKLRQILLTDTIPRKDTTYDSQDFRQSIYIPSIPTPGGKLYGTRTSTIILVDRSQRVRYVEYTHCDSSMQEYTFRIR